MRTVLPSVLPNAASVTPATGYLSERFAPPTHNLNPLSAGRHASGQILPTTFTTPRNAATRRHAAPLVNSMMPLGPMANTTLQPLPRGPPPGTRATNMPLPPGTSQSLPTSSNDGDEGENS